MIDEKFITVFLGDDYFEFVTRKTGWTQAQYRTMDTGNVKDYPVYTAALNPVAYVPKQKEALIQASDNAPIISFGANGDGSAGTNFVFHKKPFYVSNDRTCIKILEASIDPVFIYYEIQGIKETYGFDFNYKATPKNVALVSLNVPQSANDKFDLDAQRVKVASFVKYEQIKQAVNDYRKQILAALVTIEVQPPFKEVFLDNEELFELTNGDRVLKKDVIKAGIPVYSANVRQPFGFASKTILNNFSRPSLLWGIDGNFDWSLIPENTPFMPTDHCGVLRIKNPRIVPRYVYYILQATKERYGFDRTFRANLANIKMVSLPIPIKDGEYDTEVQIEVANRYERIELKKQSVLEALSRIVNTSIAL